MALGALGAAVAPFLNKETYDKAKSYWESKGVHTGSWGTPEFGITEGKANKYTAQGGSNLIDQGGQSLPTAQVQQGGQVTPIQGPGLGWGGTSDVYRAGTSSAPAPSPSPTGTNPPPTGGGGGDTRYQQLLKMDRNPKEEEELRALMAGMQPDQNAINAAYEPVINFLNTEEARISGYLPSVLQSAQEAFDVSKRTLGASREQGERQLGEQDIFAEQTRQSEENEARRLYDQLMRGGIQRFGGATSAGQGYQSLLGVEQQRVNAQIAQQYTTAKREIQNAAFSLREDYNNKMMGLEQQLRETQSNIRKEFDDRIAAIRGMRAESEGAKATAQLNALQDMRNKMYQLQLSTLEYRRNLDAQANQAASQIQQANDYWDSLVSAGQAGANTFADQTAGTRQTSYNLGATGTGAQSFSPTGRVARRREDEAAGGMVA